MVNSKAPSGITVRSRPGPDTSYGTCQTTLSKIKCCPGQPIRNQRFLMPTSRHRTRNWRKSWLAWKVLAMLYRSLAINH